ncbi:MAG: hypothetical protein JWR38_2275 [Mucilaginibacter sp.]|nr:hypothetical protein [Mucilaginibacter sp.]
MKKIIYCFAGILLPLFCLAQQGSNIRLKGFVTDSATHQPLSFTTIALYPYNSVKAMKMQTDEKGYFTMSNLKPGRYKLMLSYTGYKDLEKTIDLQGGTKDTVVHLALSSKSIDLSQVTVSGKKNLIESFGGGFQFNPKDASVNRTGSAVDLLAQVPGVIVDGGDDIKLKGNVARILVNGKLINLSGQELQNYLKSISADRIINITVNTNPSSKYDAASAGGLIDIKLKNKFDQGLSGSVSSKYETLPGTWDALNVDYTKNKFTYSFGLTYLYRKDIYLRDNYIINKSGDASNYINIQRATMPQKQEVFNPRVEINYSIDTTSFINVAINFPFFSNKFPSMLRSDNQNKSGMPINYFLQNETVDYKGNYYTYNLNYVKNFKKKDEQLSIGGFYTKTIFNPFDSFTRNYFLVNNQPDASEDIVQQSNSDRIYRSSQVQADFTLPFTKSRKLALGLKNSHSLLNNSNSIENIDSATQHFVENTALSNNLRYRENIAAVYALFSQSLKKISFGLGLRYEYSAINVNSSINNQDYGQHYSNLFPNVNFSYKLTDFQSIDFSFARKIDRPPYFLLDPFVNTSDPNNYMKGNPYLKPSYINSLELQYSKQWNSANSAIVTLAYTDNTGVYNNQITTYSPVYNHVITTNTNANNLKNLSLSIIANNKLNDWWQINSYLGLSSASLVTDSVNNFYYKPKPYFSGSIRNTFSISKNALIRLTGFYNSASYEFQAKRKGLGSISAGFQQTMLNKRLTLNLDIYDIFKTKKYTYTMNSVYYYQNSYTTIKSRYMSAALSYSFGKSFNKPDVKKLNNERIE